MGLLPLRSRACHEGRHEVLRVGERQGSQEVRHDGLRTGLRSPERQQLPHEVGGLISTVQFCLHCKLRKLCSVLQFCTHSEMLNTWWRLTLDPSARADAHA